jgi:large subunit ribosomal protein L46
MLSLLSKTLPDSKLIIRADNLVIGSSRTSGTTRTRLHVCSQCTITLSMRPNSTRNYAAAAAALKTETTTPIAEQVPSPSPSKSTNPYTIKAGVLLSRPPLLTRLPTAFESAYMFYQKRLNERLAIPFTRYFYFKKDTPADNDWKLKAKLRNGTPARELGGYNPYNSEGWNDEVLVGDQVSTREHLVDSLVKDSIMAINDDGSIKVKLESEKDGKPVELEAGQETLEDMESEGRIERPLERETTADTQVDVKRLDRCLDRTLYLVVQNEKGYWTFPTGELAGKENLHQVRIILFLLDIVPISLRWSSNRG